jgi:hypothetical protein
MTSDKREAQVCPLAREVAIGPVLDWATIKSAMNYLSLVTGHLSLNSCLTGYAP